MNIQIVRDGKKVVPTCPACGCRLDNLNNLWFHFWSGNQKDARGCSCKYFTTMWTEKNGKFKATYSDQVAGNYFG